MTENDNIRKLQLMVGRVKDLLDKGYSMSNIAAKLKVPESSVRHCKNIIDAAANNRT